MFASKRVLRKVVRVVRVVRVTTLGKFDEKYTSCCNATMIQKNVDVVTRTESSLYGIALLQDVTKPLASSNIDSGEINHPDPT